MIDLHTHLLPGIDDGAESVIEAGLMAKTLYHQNVSKVVCTPHFDPTKTSLYDFIDLRSRSIEMLIGIEIELVLGSETILHDYLFHYPDISELCIENTRYLLIELPHGFKWSEKAYDTLANLISYYDIVPVIAHIERYHKRKSRSRHINKLRRMGCVIQLNTTSIIDDKSRKQALHYIKKGYIDVLGSDCHNMLSRPPIFSEALDIINKKIGEQYCSEFMNNAERLIEGRELKEKKAYILPDNLL
ncbi:hypothetical protein I5677_00685 [Mobilitalea sibirica]|uniref:protein-tyrosine-phosphatase n=1 Tax=Mobilitalea sibirica TaxID=1462919 RepID=A0A8J7H088_9FIRM|nr:CpsB/CapC family capsule biosynthesis tyrosine phosphatase [Mobilitalea sibirica]MBH1939403.1 hypothetical protein [Mobilitalea sibirica]